MADIGTWVIYVVMFCAVLGALASLKNDEEGLGKEFILGLHSIGPIFIPVAGIMASIPYLSALVEAVFGPIFAAIGADPAMVATAIIAVDMGGYQLADTLAQSREGWIMAAITGYMAGATIVFSIPVGLSMLDKDDHPYMALGIMSGILSVPIGVFVATLLVMVAEVPVRPGVDTAGEATLVLAFAMPAILLNLLPLIVFVVAIALGLRLVPNTMIRGFMLFGRGMDICIRVVLVLSIVEYFTGAFSKLFGAWGFDPIIADEKDQFRALEIAGYIGIMLCGAFPMVYLIRTRLGGLLQKVGQGVGLEGPGAAGLLATIANILAMFRLIRDMRPRDKVLNIAFAVCAAFMFGDHLAFTANFQPSLVAPIMLGKLAGGICGFIFAYWLSLPALRNLER